MPAEVLRAELVGMAGRLAAGTYELLVLVGELDARGTWSLWGALSCAAWLASACEVEVSTARSQVRVARALRDHPALDAAMRQGDVSYAKARVLVPYLTVDNAEVLVSLAESTPAGRLGAAIAAWSQRHDGRQGHRHRRRHAARSLSWRTEPDGMVTITTAAHAHGGRLGVHHGRHTGHPGAHAHGRMPLRSNAPTPSSPPSRPADR